MARPLKEGLTFFKHDTDASTDEKIEALRTIYKNDGYAFYFILLERIYRTNNAELDISDEDTCKILAKKIMVSLPKFHALVKASIKQKLFDSDAFSSRNVLTSTGIQKRAKSVFANRMEAREEYNSHKIPDNQIQNSTVSESETKVETKVETLQETKVETLQETKVETPQDKNKSKNKIIDIDKERDKNIEFLKIIKLFDEEYKTESSSQSSKTREDLNDILETYGYDIFYKATKKVAGTSKCKLAYVSKIMEDYKFNGVPSDNGKKPQVNSNNTSGYKINPNQYSDVRDYGKYGTAPTP
jgi:hypothetical protein